MPMYASEILSPASYLTFLALVWTSVSAALPVQPKGTITFPDGVTYNGNSSLICTPTTWSDIVTFLVGNYLSHAATIITSPGEPSFVVVFNITLAILFPTIGATRGLLALIRHPATYTDPIQQALRSRAVCMVVRSPHWKPCPGVTMHSLSLVPKSLRHKFDGENAYDIITEQEEDSEDDIRIEVQQNSQSIEIRVATPPWLALISPLGRPEIVAPGQKIFGKCTLPAGFELAYVPPHAIVEPVPNEQSGPGYSESENDGFTLSSSYSFLSAAVAIVQIIYASATLYRSRGNQIARYGYAAFGFTVLPYLFMSLLNFLGNMVSPSYSTCYLVQTDVMDEAAQRGGHFEGIVGKLENAPVPEEHKVPIFSGSFVEHRRGHFWTFQLSDNQQVLGEKSESIQSTAQTTDDEAGEQDPSQSSAPTTVVGNLQNPKIQSTSPSHQEQSSGKPLLVCPSCSSFKASEDHSFFSLDTPTRHGLIGKIIFMIFTWAVPAVSLAVIGGMSGFEAGSSSVGQRVWTMIWLAGGTLVTLMIDPNVVIRLVSQLAEIRKRLVANPQDDEEREDFRDHLLVTAVLTLPILICAVTAIGGFVVVVQMLQEYGSCSLLT